MSNCSAGILIKQISPNFRILAFPVLRISYLQWVTLKFVMGGEASSLKATRKREKHGEHLTQKVFFRPGLDVASITSAHVLWARLNFQGRKGSALQSWLQSGKAGPDASMSPTLIKAVSPSL